jgi:hypothetical protein
VQCQAQWERRRKRDCGACERQEKAAILFRNTTAAAQALASGGSVIFGFNTDVTYADTVYHVQSEARLHELLLQTLVFVKGRCIGKHQTSYAEKTREPDFSEEHMHEMLRDQHKRFVAAVRAGRIEDELAEEHKPVASTLAGPAAPLATAAPVASEAVAPAPPEMPVLAPTVAADLTPPSSILEMSECPGEIAPPTVALDDLTAEFAAAVAAKPVDPGLILTPAGKLIGKGLSLECLPPATSPNGREVIIGVQVADENGPAGGAQVTCRITSGRRPATYVYATSGPGGVADVTVSLSGLDLAGTALLIQASHRGKSASRKYSLHPAS